MESSSLCDQEAHDLIRRTQEHVRDYMKSPRFDASHDYKHVTRVVKLAKHIREVELQSDSEEEFHPLVVELAAWLHDIEDSKYTTLSAEAQEPQGAMDFLLFIGCPPEVAHAAQNVINAVSYTREIRSPELVQKTLAAHPELAIVQDADRLDALGAVGIGRTFVYGAVKDEARGMEGTLKHFDDKLLHLQGMMKTAEGKRLAKVRTERLRIFKEWWEEETRE